MTSVALLNGMRRLKQRSRRSLQALADRAVFAAVRLRFGPGRVLSGPFRGMRFDTHYRHGTPQALALGTYEKELWPVLEKLKGMRFERFFDVGGADGFYAVGGALFWNVGQVVVFEALEEGRTAIGGHARLNGVAGKVEIRGFCREEELASLLDPGRRDLLLMDVEGAEAELLSDRVCRSLVNSAVIVEAHDFIRPGLTGLIAGKFAGTHQVEIVSSLPRAEGDWPVQGAAPRRSKLRLMDERRPCPMQWVACLPPEK